MKMIRALKNSLRSLWGLLFYSNPIASTETDAWRQQDVARLENAPGINPNRLGKLLGAGLQHRIYAYAEEGAPMVLKVATPNRLLRFPSAQDAQADLEFISRFFKPFAVEPAQVILLRDGGYAVKQRRLNQFRSITPRDLENNNLRQQFQDVVQRNQAMMKAVGRSLDFLGGEGQRKCRAALVGFHQTPTISNLVIESQADGSEQIRILDTDLENFFPGAHNLRDLRSAFAAHVAVEINRVLIRKFFRIDIQGKLD